MPMSQRVRLLVRVFCELLIYDIVMALGGFAGIHRWARRRACGRRASAPEQVEPAILSAMSQVTSFYWKPIRCLQRSVVTARLLARYGVPAEVVIGYRPAPFFSHAWVEVGGRIANDPRGYQRTLQILERL